MLRLALRRLARQPSYVVAALVSLAVGIATATVMAGVVDALFFRPPAHATDPARLVDVAVRTYPDHVALGRGVPAFVGVAAYTPRPFPYTVVADGAVLPARAALVSHTLFGVLGARPALGRWFAADEDRPGAPRAVVLAHDFWRAHFGGDPAVLGRAVRLAGDAFTVVGVAPRGFTGATLAPVDLFVPMTNVRWFGGAEALVNRDYQWVRVVARLRPGVAPSAAGAQATAVYRRENVGVRSVDQATLSSAVVAVRPLVAARRDLTKPELRVALWLAGVAAVVLLVACANVATLALARAVRDRRALATLAALGASRGRLGALLGLECALLAAAGGAGALALARWGGAVVRTRLLDTLAGGVPALDGRVLAGALAATTLAALAGGLLPSLRGTRLDVSAELRAGARAVAPHTHLRRAVVTLQVALALVLVVGAALFGVSLRNAVRAEVGFDPEGLVVADVDLLAAGYEPARAHALIRAALERLARIPGVATVAATNAGVIPNITLAVATPGGAPVSDSTAAVSSATEGYFRALRLPVRAGRAFTAAELAGDAPVVVVNETLARQRWPGRSAVGACVVLRARGHDPGCATVVGVVADRRTWLRDSVARPELFVPFGTARLPAGVRPIFLTGTVVLRLAPGARADRVTAPARATLAELAPSLPVVLVRPATALFDPQRQAWLMGASLCAVFAAVAVGLALFGAYAAVAYTVAQRLTELGVRAAVGARPGRLAALVLGEALRVAGAGVVIGGLAAGVAARGIGALLYGVAPLAPGLYAACGLAVLVAAVLAAAGPARRAARVDPARALSMD
jgi:predicted permease